jgi:peptide maturation system acyl carrier-related protein
MISSEIQDKLRMIFKHRTEIDFLQNKHLQDIKLLGRELVLILFDIEKEFDIQIPKAKVIEGYFDTYANIERIVMEQCCHMEQCYHNVMRNELI